MALEVITAPPFGGKGRAARDLVEQREAAGELGLMVIDFTALFLALVPGVLSSYRDAEVSESGAPALTGYLFAAAVRQAVATDMNGYVLLNSPRRAADVAAQVGATELLEVEVSVDQVADRIDVHLSDLRRVVPRARNATATARCATAAATYYREAAPAFDRLPRRKVRRRGRRYVTDPNRERGFDEAAFLRGLSPAGRAARAALLADGVEATPAAIFRRVLQERLQ